MRLWAVAASNDIGCCCGRRREAEGQKLVPRVQKDEGALKSCTWVVSSRWAAYSVNQILIFSSLLLCYPREPKVKCDWDVDEVEPCRRCIRLKCPCEVGKDGRQAPRKRRKLARAGVFDRPTTPPFVHPGHVGEGSVHRTDYFDDSSSNSSTVSNTEHAPGSEADAAEMLVFLSR